MWESFLTESSPCNGQLHVLWCRSDICTVENLLCIFPFLFILYPNIAFLHTEMVIGSHGSSRTTPPVSILANVVHNVSFNWLRGIKHVQLTILWVCDCKETVVIKVSGSQFNRKFSTSFLERLTPGGLLLSPLV